MSESEGEIPNNGDENFAEQYLNETSETRQHALLEIRTWIVKNPQLHIRSEDKYILPFLRGCKFNIDQTKEKLRNFYNMKRDRPEWFSNRNPRLPQIKELANLGCFVPLRKTKDNQLVVIIRVAAHNPSKHKINDVFKTGKMILDVACMEEKKTQLYGIIAVFDMQGVGFALARQMSPSLIGNAVHAWQNYHCRPQKLEFINAPIYINVVLDIFKSFMSSKLKGRVRVHFGGNESIHNVVDKEILPPEYGGNGESIKNLANYWYEKLEKYADWFAEDEQFKAE